MKDLRFVDDQPDHAQTHGGPAPGRVSLTSRLAPRPAHVYRAAEAARAAAPPPAAAPPAGVDPFAIHLASADASASSPLPAPLRAKFESSLGADLSGVRVHTGGESATAARAIGARAYATGSHIHFGAGQFDPSSPAGEHLLAHEVAHTAQQGGGDPAPQRKAEVSEPGDACETEADAAAVAMVAGEPARVSASAGIARTIMRTPDGGAAPAPPAKETAKNTGAKITFAEVKRKFPVQVGGVTLDLEIKLAGDMRTYGSATGSAAPGNGTEVKVGGVGNAAKPSAGIEAEVKKKFRIAALGLKPEIKLSNEASFFGKGEVKLGEISVSPHEASFFGGAVKWKPMFPVFKILKWEPGKAPELGKFALKSEVTFDGSHLLKNAKPGEKAEVHVTLEGSAALAVWQTLWKQLLQRYGATVASRALLPSGAVAALVGGLMMIAAANNHGKKLEALADATSGECRNYCLSFVRAVMNQGAAAGGGGGEKGWAAGQAKRAALIAQHGSAELVDAVLRDKYKSPAELYNEIFTQQYDDYWLAAVKEYRSNNWFSSTFHGEDHKFGDYMNARSAGKGFGKGGDGG